MILAEKPDCTDFHGTLQPQVEETFPSATAVCFLPENRWAACKLQSAFPEAQECVGTLSSSDLDSRAWAQPREGLAEQRRRPPLICLSKHVKVEVLASSITLVRVYQKYEK
jgi:hypothetical protein